MRALARNKQTIWYALYQGKTEQTDEGGYFTGEYVETYATPVSLKINVSPAKGMTDVEIFGIESQYSKTLVTADMSCPINEYSRIWIDRVPSETIQGQTVTHPHNYVVEKVAKGLNSIVYALKEVDVS